MLDLKSSNEAILEGEKAAQAKSQQFKAQLLILRNLQQHLSLPQEQNSKKQSLYIHKDNDLIECKVNIYYLYSLITRANLWNL